MTHGHNSLLLMFFMKQLLTLITCLWKLLETSIFRSFFFLRQLPLTFFACVGCFSDLFLFPFECYKNKCRCFFLYVASNRSGKFECKKYKWTANARDASGSERRKRSKNGSCTVRFLWFIAQLFTFVVGCTTNNKFLRFSTKEKNLLIFNPICLKCFLRVVHATWFNL